MNYKTKRKLSLLILLVGLPLYAASVVTVMALFVNLPNFLELFMYVFFGIIWVFPLKFVFRGVGQSDPNE